MDDTFYAQEKLHTDIQDFTDLNEHFFDKDNDRMCFS